MPVSDAKRWSAAIGSVNIVIPKETYGFKSVIIKAMTIKCAMEKFGHAAVRSFVITSALFLHMFSCEKESFGRGAKFLLSAKKLEVILFATRCQLF